jgi:hypothetical protein
MADGERFDKTIDTLTTVAEQRDRLREVVEWACAYMSNSHDLNIKNYVEPELRKKAGKEG